MQSKLSTGPVNGPQKYDLLTAMAVTGLSAGAVQQTTLFRLMALITARYNWSTDTLSIGQREMAAIWSVDERTAKRETKRLLDSGFLWIKRPGARGRVASYGLGVERILSVSGEKWASVGTDFSQRMTGMIPKAAPQTSVVRVDFVNRSKQCKLSEDPEWQKAMQMLEQSHPAQHRAWLVTLALESADEAEIHLVAPTRFAARYIDTHLMPILEDAVAHAFATPKRCIIRSASD